MTTSTYLVTDESRFRLHEIVADILVSTKYLITSFGDVHADIGRH